MPRSTQSRLEALEAKAAQHWAEVEAVKDRQIAAVLQALAPADLFLAQELYARAKVEDMSAWWDEVGLVGEVVGSEFLPGGEAAKAWTEQFTSAPDGLPTPRPPIGAVGYLAAEAARYDDIQATWQADGLPDGVTLNAVRWCAVTWRFFSALAEELERRA